MKLRALLTKLQSLERKLPPKSNPEVLVDFNEDGYYNLEKVEIVTDKEDGKTYINLKSSNES